MEIFAEKLLAALKDLEIIDAATLDKVFASCTETQCSFVDVLLDKDLISATDLGRTIANVIHFPYVSLDKVALTPALVKILPESYARLHRVVVFEDGPKALKVAMVEPQNEQLLKFIEQKVHKTVQAHFATEGDIEKAFTAYKNDLRESFDELLKHQVDIMGDGKIQDAPIIKVVDLLIEYAASYLASDIHIEPEKEGAKVRFRIDGVMSEVLKLPLDIYQQVILRIKVLAKMQTDDHLSAQDGKLQVKITDEKLDVRVSTIPTTHGEKCVLRLLSEHARQFSLANLGMLETDFQKVTEAIASPYGMILATGPTGCGKTTSMYAILKMLNQPNRNIATIEDPVEYDIDGINQIQVNPNTNLTFAEGLRSLLRQDPNVIYVGEIRDKETADIAINAALTGHVVLSTLHTNDAATAIPRFLDMDVEPFLVSSTIRLIIAQRLVRKICDACKFSETVPVNDLHQHFSPELVKKIFGKQTELRLYRGKGCPLCHNLGYRGRVGIFEVLKMSETIKQLIQDKADAEVISAAAVKEGMTTMLEDGLLKMTQGLTTAEEILQATKSYT